MGMAGVMEGKRVLVIGARNKWSIAWHGAVSLHREGAEIAFSVYGEREEGGVRKLLSEQGWDAPIFHCDVTNDEQVNELMAKVGTAFDGKLDGIIHAVSFANKDELGGAFTATSKAGFTLAQESNVYSLITITRAARPLMIEAGGGAVVTLSYLGAERVVPNYNVMGVAKAGLEACVRYLAADVGTDNIRVNAISAGPIKTLAASAITGFDSMVNSVAEHAPLRRKVDAEEVGDSLLFLLSPWARGITGETLYVDCGYHIVGMVE